MRKPAQKGYILLRKDYYTGTRVRVQIVHFSDMPPYLLSS